MVDWAISSAQGGVSWGATRCYHGLAEIEDQRVDVVADNELIDAGVPIRVCEIEGNRVVVEAIDDEIEAGES